MKKKKDMFKFTYQDSFKHQQNQEIKEDTRKSYVDNLNHVKISPKSYNHFLISPINKYSHICLRMLFLPTTYKNFVKIILEIFY